MKAFCHLYLTAYGGDFIYITFCFLKVLRLFTAITFQQFGSQKWFHAKTAIYWSFKWCPEAFNVGHWKKTIGLEKSM